jgi:fermentation-respiration switch protein FrsA (DUF1100 family)
MSLHPPSSFRRDALLTGSLVASTWLGSIGCATLARPALGSVGPVPTWVEQKAGASAVEFDSKSGSRIHAWLIPGRLGAGAVLLLHGAHENRLRMMGRARFLHAAGYTVLAPDFQAHGESPGKFVSFGALESLDALASLEFLRAQAPKERVAVIGVSMGGAAALLGPGPLHADALVLESVYPTIDDAVTDRLTVWLGPLGFTAPAISPMLISGVGSEIGVANTDLRPIDRIGQVAEPVMVISGSKDRYTPLAEATALFDQARSPKEFWAVIGAGHEDLHEFTPGEYERRVGEFLARWLRPTEP